MPKRKVHIWFGSRNRITGSELTAVSTNSEFNVQLMSSTIFEYSLISSIRELPE